MHIKDFDPYDFSKKEINGVTVYYKNLPWAPCIHARLTFCVGAFNDLEDKEGTAHFLEHMMFDGFPGYPDKKSINEFSRLYMIKSHNATTSFNWTSYHGRFLPEHLKTVTKFLLAQVFTPFLREEDVEHERKVITQEAWGRFKNEKLLNYTKKFVSTLYSQHNHRRLASALGWPDTVAKITQKDLEDFHKKHYVKENLTIFLVGAIEEKDLDFLESVLVDIPTLEKSERDDGVIVEPLVKRMEVNSEEIGDPKEQLELEIIRTTSALTEEEKYVGYQSLNLIQDALLERLRTENSLCYSVGVFGSYYKDFFDYGIYLKTSEDKLVLAEEEIWNILNEIVEGKWRDRFVLIYKMSIDRVKSKERLSQDIIEDSSKDLICFERLETLKESIANYERVRYEDVVEFIKKVFDKKYVFTEVVYPSKSKNKAS